LINPVFNKSPLQLLCGASKSYPTIDIINFLVAANPIALQFPAPTPFDLFCKNFTNTSDSNITIGVGTTKKKPRIILKNWETIKQSLNPIRIDSISSHKRNGSNTHRKKQYGEEEQKCEKNIELECHLILHHYILRREETFKILNHIKMYPESVTKYDSYGRKALHIYLLTNHNSIKLLDAILSTKENASYQIMYEHDNSGKTPYELLFEHSTQVSVDIIMYLLSKYPDLKTAFRYNYWSFCRDHLNFFEIDDILNETTTIAMKEEKNDTMDNRSDDTSFSSWTTEVRKQKELQRKVIETKLNLRLKEEIVFELLTDTAATNIQRVARGFLCRKNIIQNNILNSAAIDIQKYMRGAVYRLRHVHPIKVLKGLRLVLVVIKIQYEKILAIKTQCFDAFPPNYRRKVMYYEEAEVAISNAKANSYPLLKLYRSILDCYKSIDEKALIIKHIQLNVNGVDDAQGLVITILKQLATLQYVINRMEEILPFEIMNSRNKEDIDIDSDEEEHMMLVMNKKQKTGKKHDVKSRRASSIDDRERREQQDKWFTEKSASILFDDDTQSVSTDYEEGLAAFSGEYLAGLNQEDQLFWRKLEFDYNAAIWERLDYRDANSFHRIDEFLDNLDKLEEDNEKHINDDVQQKEHDQNLQALHNDDESKEYDEEQQTNYEHGDEEDDDWYEDLHEEDIDLLDKLDNEIENIEKENKNEKKETLSNKIEEEKGKIEKNEI